MNQERDWTRTRTRSEKHDVDGALAEMTYTTLPLL